MRSPAGDDASPHGLWQGTMMANAFRDPYWRAQVAKESAAAPERTGEIQALCIRCHAPMAHHTAELGGQPARTIATVADDPLARDGVSCTVCHQIQPEGLGEAETFAGMLRIGRDRAIFGPYSDPAPGPMRMHSGYTPTHGKHVKDAALCGTCHTLFTGHTGTAFAEQTPYLEWRNSAFQNERDAAPESRTCQDCHMPRIPETRIARNPMGRDFLIPPRPAYATHVFVGGNAFMLDLLRVNRASLGVTATEASLELAAEATRRQLRHETARLTVGALTRKNGRLEFAVKVENLTGHKLPTGYPARRAWIHVQVREGGNVVFESGAVDEQGRLKGVADELGLSHATVVEKPGEVVVYELIAIDQDGKATTHLARMARRGKDTRILPRGWRSDGPHAEATTPIGIGADPDFVAGSDVVTFRVPLPEMTPKGVQVVAWLDYQSIPPAWVAALRPVDATEARAFLTMYDAAGKTPDTIGFASRVEE
jgi:hypothetical protein